MVVDVVYEEVEVAANNEIGAEEGPEEPPGNANQVSGLQPQWGREGEGEGEGVGVGEGKG